MSIAPQNLPVTLIPHVSSARLVVLRNQFRSVRNTLTVEVYSYLYIDNNGNRSLTLHFTPLNVERYVYETVGT